MPALLEVRTLWKSFGGVHAVRDCSFDVEAGRITGLIGPNGAGKSTAIDLISGFLEPDAGVIRFAGLDVQGRPAHRVARLGLVRTFQSPRVWAGLTVMENMLLAAPRSEEHTSELQSRFAIVCRLLLEEKKINKKFYKILEKKKKKLNDYSVN